MTAASRPRPWATPHGSGTTSRVAGPARRYDWTAFQNQHVTVARSNLHEQWPLAIVGLLELRDCRAAARLGRLQLRLARLRLRAFLARTCHPRPSARAENGGSRCAGARESATRGTPGGNALLPLATPADSETPTPKGIEHQLGGDSNYGDSSASNPTAIADRVRRKRPPQPAGVSEGAWAPWAYGRRGDYMPRRCGTSATWSIPAYQRPPRLERRLSHLLGVRDHLLRPDVRVLGPVGLLVPHAREHVRLLLHRLQLLIQDVARDAPHKRNPQDSEKKNPRLAVRRAPVPALSLSSLWKPRVRAPFPPPPRAHPLLYTRPHTAAVFPRRARARATKAAARASPPPRPPFLNPRRGAHKQRSQRA